MAIKIFHDQSQQKYGTRLAWNFRPLDLQPDSLLTALCGLSHGFLPALNVHIHLRTDVHLAKKLTFVLST